MSNPMPTFLPMNWKTTITGVGAIAAGVVALAQALTAGTLDFNAIVADFGVIAAGFMGLFAKDNNVTGSGSTAVSH